MTACARMPGGTCLTGVTCRAIGCVMREEGIVARSGPSTQTATCTACGYTARNPRPHPCRRRRIRRWLSKHRPDLRKASRA